MPPSHLPLMPTTLRMSLFFSVPHLWLIVDMCYQITVAVCKCGCRVCRDSTQYSMTKPKCERINPRTIRSRACLAHRMVDDRGQESQLDQISSMLWKPNIWSLEPPKLLYDLINGIVLVVQYKLKNGYTPFSLRR